MDMKRVELEPWQEALLRAEEARRRGIPEWMLPMLEATPDSLLRDIVRDNRRSTSLPGVSGEPVKPGGGWVEPRVEDRSRDFELMDKIVEGLVGGPNDTSKLK